MPRFIAPALILLAAPLAACGGDGDDRLADQVEDQAETEADALEANGMEAEADRIEDAGEARADAIDDSDVDADQLTPEQRNSMIMNGTDSAM